MTGPASTRDLTITRVFDAPVERVWRLWAEPGQVEQWWGPKGFTSPNPRIDFREGGVSLVSMHAPAEYGMPDLYNTWTYRAIEPLLRIEFTLNFTDPQGRKLDPAAAGLPEGVPADVLHEITFWDAGGGRTEMTFTERGYTTDQAYELSKSGLEDVLDKMADVLAKG